MPKSQVGNSVEFPQGAPVAPRTLSRDEKAIWKRLVALLSDARVLSPGFAPTVEVFVGALADYRQASQQLRKNGRYFLRGKKPCQYWSAHPAIRDRRDAYKIVKEFCAMFGLSPDRCLRVALPREKPEEPTRPKVFARKR